MVWFSRMAMVVILHLWLSTTASRGHPTIASLWGTCPHARTYPARSHGPCAWRQTAPDPGWGQGHAQREPCKTAEAVDHSDLHGLLWCRLQRPCALNTLNGEHHAQGVYCSKGARAMPRSLVRTGTDQSRRGWAMVPPWTERSGAARLNTGVSP